MNATQPIILNEELRKSTGSHYTPTILADFVAKKIIREWYQSNNTTLSSVKILDPAVGDGELLYSMLDTFGKDVDVEVSGFDTNYEATELAQLRLCQDFPQTLIDLRHDDFLDFVLEKFGTGNNGDLFAQINTEPKFDIVIANPPYVRTQVLGAQKSQKLAKQFGLSGRVDLYHAFILGIAEVMEPGGILGIIVSNRFMTTKSGVGVRTNICDLFDILHIWDLGDTRLFEAAVLPAVLLLKRKDGHCNNSKSKFTSIYSTHETSPFQKCETVIDALDEDGLVGIGSGEIFVVQQGELDFGNSPREVWRISTEDSKKWLNTVAEHTYCEFGDVGKIRVGVKTTADKVFIRKDWEDVPNKQAPELLRPLTTHHVARRFRGLDTDRQILYPHCVIDGKRSAVNLDEYPNSKSYLEEHYALLESRKYVIEAGRNWYEVWVPQDPGAWKFPKIVFRDISEKPTFWMDQKGTVVNGDCYWLPCENIENMDMFWLALAIGNSTFIEEFYDRRFNNKLYAGRRRFITQYVEKFPLPSPTDNIGKKIIKVTKELYEMIPSKKTENVELELDALVWQAFGFLDKKIIG